MEDPLVTAADAVQKVSSQYRFNREHDEFDLFGQTVAEKLRQLPLEMALETEEMILSTIRMQRVSLLSKHSPPS